MFKNATPFIPTRLGYYHPPLERFLPSMPIGVFSEWLQTNTKIGDLVIDPLGANPLLAIETAKTNRRILFSRNNPILWLMLEVMASAPHAEDFHNALNKLMLTRRDGQTLDEHLATLYATPCAECDQMIQPVGYIWDQGSSQPSFKYYHCPHCSDHGERPVSGYDIENLQKLGNLGLHRARAFQRVMHGGDYEKESINNALDSYLPRALYVIMTLINRLDGLDVTKTERRLLQALLVCIFDDGNSLRHWPEKNHRYLQLGVPSRFIEKNLWYSINNYHQQWQVIEHPIPVSYWPNIPKEDGGICLYQRRLAENNDLLAGLNPSAIVTIFPRPNQAFWTLSALWSGWLWGRKAVTPMRSALARRHYNWYWFSQAINATINRITKQIMPPQSAFGILPQIASNHFFGMLVGMHCSGMQLNGTALRLGEGIAQCHWISPQKELNSDEAFDFLNHIQRYLVFRGEPADFQLIFFHVLSEMAIQGHIPTDIDAIKDTLLREIQEKITITLQNRSIFKNFETGLSSGSRWWLVNPVDLQPPLSERVEDFIRKILLDSVSINTFDLEKAICSFFPGLLTPDEELVRICLESYADPNMTDRNAYTITRGETSEARQNDLDEILSILKKQGESFGLTVSSENQTSNWLTDNNEPLMRYHLTITANLAETILKPAISHECRNIIVFPGSRSRLIEYRLRFDPQISEALEHNWLFLKFRYLRWMVKREHLSLDLWNNLLGGDPPAWDPPKQLQFF